MMSKIDNAQKTGSGLLLKIYSISFIFVFLTILIPAVLSIISMKNLSLDTAIRMGRKSPWEITGGMNEMAFGADQSNTAVNRVNELSSKNHESINQLINT